MANVNFLSVFGKAVGELIPQVTVYISICELYICILSRNINAMSVGMFSLRKGI